MKKKSCAVTKRDIVCKAIEFAARAHAGQFRKSTKVPYISHPLGTGLILRTLGAPDYVAAAGFLHDTVEDTNITVNGIKKAFGPKVAKIVEGATEPDKSDTWWNRKKHKIEHLKKAPKYVVLVAFADKLDSITFTTEELARVGSKMWKRFNSSKKDQHWYYRSLLDVFDKRMKTKKERRMLKAFRKKVNSVFGTERR